MSVLTSRAHWVKTQPRTPADCMGLVSSAKIAMSCRWFCILLAVLGILLLSCSKITFFHVHSGAIFKHSKLSSVNLMSIVSIQLASLLIKILKNRFLQNPIQYIFFLWYQPLKTNLWKCFFQAVVYHLIMASAVLNKVETLWNSVCYPAAATSYPLPIILQSRKLDWFDKINFCQIHLAI